eukprot:1761428-Rhodomonas_salina.1
MGRPPRTRARYPLLSTDLPAAPSLGPGVVLCVCSFAESETDVECVCYFTESETDMECVCQFTESGTDMECVCCPGTKIEDIDVFSSPQPPHPADQKHAVMTLRHHIVVYERTSTGQQLRILDLTPPANANANSPAPPPRSGLVQFSASCGFPHVTTPPPKRRNWGLTVHSQRLLELPGAKSGRNLQPGANCDIDAGLSPSSVLLRRSMLQMPPASR